MADVAAFDFDGTLTDGRQRLRLPRRPARPGPVAAGHRRARPPAGPRRAGRRHGRRRDQGAAVRARPGREWPLRVEEVSERFARRHLDPAPPPRRAGRFDWHRRRGDRVVIVSASPEVYVRVAGELPRCRRGGGHPPGRRRPGRTHRSLRGGQLPGRGEAPPPPGVDGRGRAVPGRLWAYGNSRGDLRMLRAADVGVNVGRLGPVGRLGGSPASAGPPRPRLTAGDAADGPGPDVPGVAHRYSFFRIQTRTNQPQMGGR